jgi:hypothetical protein
MMHGILAENYNTSFLELKGVDFFTTYTDIRNTVYCIAIKQESKYSTPSVYELVGPPKLLVKRKFPITSRREQRKGCRRKKLV